MLVAITFGSTDRNRIFKKLTLKLDSNDILFDAILNTYK